MYTIPYTGTRVVLKKDQRDTISMAITPWGRRRAETFFSGFLDDRELPEDCAKQYPLTAWRYARVQAKNRSEVIRGKDDVVASKKDLRFTELRYLRLIRRLETTQDNSQKLSLSGILEAILFRLEKIANGAHPLTGQFQPAPRIGE